MKMWIFIVAIIAGLSDLSICCKPTNSRYIDNCVSCGDWKCLECEPGYYGDYCHYKCGSSCYTCTSIEECTTCIDGFYGMNCTSDCPNYCKNNTCDTSGGDCLQCIDGYYKNLTECLKCPDGCVNCESRNGCNQCQYGYFFEQTAPSNQCSECSQNCTRCANTSSCTECNKGYANVDGACVSCLNCVNSTSCSIDNQCSQCLDGFWGSYCGSRCNESCTECDKSTGVCTGCRDDRFGQFCELECSRNCLTSSDNTSSCFKHNGTCTDGCKEQYTGENCTEAVPTTSTSSPDIFVIIGVAVAGVVTLIIVVVTAILIYRRKKATARGLTGATENCNNPYSTDESLARDQTRSGAIKDPGDAMYAVVNKKRNVNDSVYDTTSGRTGQVSDTTLVCGNTDAYSHVNHAFEQSSKSIGDNDEYDRIVRTCNNTRKYDDGNTYDVTSKRHRGDAESGYSNDDEYDQVFRNEQRNCDDGNTYDVTAKQRRGDVGSECSNNDEYDQVLRNEQRNCDDGNAYDVAALQCLDDAGSAYSNVSDVK